MSKGAEAFVSRYAKGLMDVLEKNAHDPKLDQILKELQKLGALMSGETEAFFANPTFTMEEKRDVLSSILQEMRADPALVRFFELVLSLGHLKLSDGIAHAFEDELHERRQELRGTLRSAFPLTSQELKELASALEKATGKKMLLEVKEDPDLIGGVVAHVGSVVYDASIRGFLNRLQQEL